MAYKEPAEENGWEINLINQGLMKMKNYCIPYGRQWIGQDDISSVLEVLKTDWITQGPKIKEFEEELAKYCDCKYAVAVSSGTAALHLACLAAGLNQGDEGITTPISFLATANSLIYTGAKPVFADIDYDTTNIDPEQVKRNISARTKVILPVHFAGLPCDIKSISKIATEKKLIVIEDACHALGAEYKLNAKWFKVGSCRHSDMTAFSFHPVKAITMGEGGAVTTNNKKLYVKLLALRSHGIYKTKKMTHQHGLWYYEMRDLGFNYRITDFQCALGISQLRKIDSFIKRRCEIASIYDKAFGNIDGIDIPQTGESNRHVYHLYFLKIDFKKFKTNRQKSMSALKNKGILTQTHYIPIYRHPYYQRKYSVRFRDFSQSEAYYKRTLSIPIYPAMKNSDIRNIINAVKSILNK